MNEDNQNIFQRAVSGTKQFLRPQTGTLATSGRQAIQRIARTPLTPSQQRAAESVMSVVQPAADYSRYQVFEPLLRGAMRATDSNRGPIERAVGGLETAAGVWGATPVGVAENALTGMVAGSAQNLRGGVIDPRQQNRNMVNAMTRPVSVGQSVGIVNPVASTLVDLMVANPVGAARLARIAKELPETAPNIVRWMADDASEILKRGADNATQSIRRNMTPVTLPGGRRSVVGVERVRNLLRSSDDVAQPGGITKTGERVTDQYIRRTPPEESFGLMAGIEPEFDEEGNLTGIRYNPEKGAMGVAGLIGGKQARNFAGSRQFSSLLDQKPRFEIDDSGAKINLSGPLESLGKQIRKAGLDFDLPRVKALSDRLQSSLENNQFLLGDILDHDELYRNYPDLRDVRVTLDSTRTPGSGSYNPATNTITISGNPFAQKDLFLHEIQHAIQEAEGFARGGNPATAGVDMGRYHELRSIFQKRLKEIESIKDPIKRSEDARKVVNSELYKEYTNLENNIGRFITDPKAAFNDYKRLSGELESRAVQRRMDMTPAERAVTDPYSAEALATAGTTDPSAFITRFDGGRAMSVSDDQRNLVALHNTSLDNLAKSKELGGLPAPSVAITRKDLPFEQFGDVTMVGTKDLIDPMSGTSRVFSQDVWSPTVPAPVFDIDKKKTQEIYRAIENVVGSDDRSLGKFSTMLDDETVPVGELAEYLSKESTGIQRAVIKSLGEDPAVVLKEAPSGIHTTTPIQGLIEKYGRYIDYQDVQPGSDIAKDVSDAIRRAIQEQTSSIDSDSLRKTIKDSYESRFFGEDGSLSWGSLDRLMDEASSAKNFDTSQIDELETARAVKRQVSSLGIENSILQRAQELVSGARGEKGLRSGSKKLPYTLENIVDAMTKGIKNKQQSLVTGIGKMRSAGAKEFKSIDQIRSAEDMLGDPDDVQRLTESARDTFTESIVPMFYELADEQDMNTIESLAQAVERYGKGSKTTNKLIASLERKGFRNVPDKELLALKQWADDLFNMPTDYFESKIQRAVDLGEFDTAIVPSGEVERAREILGDAINIIEYDPSKKGARSNIIKSLEGVAFSLAPVIFGVGAFSQQDQ